MTNQDKPEEGMTQTLIDLVNNDNQISKSVFSRGKPTQKQLKERKQILQRINQYSPIDIEKVYNL